MADESTEKTTEHSDEVIADIAKNGKQSGDAMRPDPKQIDKEGLDESHGTDDGKPKPNPKDKPTDEKPTEEEKPEQEWNKDDYVTIDNPHATAAINLLKEAKVSPVEANDVFQKAIEANDLSKVDWARLEKLVGADKALLIRGGVERYYNEQYAETVKTTEAAYELFNGEEGWAKARKHFQALEKKDPAFKAKLNDLRKGLDANGWLAEQSLKELHRLYNEDPNTEGTGTKKIVAGDKTISKEQGLTKAQYREELQKLGNNPNPTEYNKLKARRQAAMLAGIN